MKKKLLLISLICFAVSIFTVSFLFAQTSINADRKITKVEVKPDTAELVLDTVKILYFTNTLKLTYRKVDDSEKSIGEEATELFQDIVDDPETVEDETKTDFTDLMAKIPGIEKIFKTEIE